MHTANDNPLDAAGTPGEAVSHNPQVRTLLLTDLCDSTLLVERLGDGAAAELFRDHDRLVLGLQQRWRGRLIDRSDGLLLLFERAIDGLGFALDYARGLRELGERRDVAKHGVALLARQGLHVGEVLTWRNSDVAVSIGAKPLEVEGLAKPMAGRLMTLARPGQILLSATAEPLAHRAARELGERGEQLLWKDWGRWRFKGVPQAQQVYEVGEPGIAPLRTPQQNRAKAWRDIPLWRRPAALAAELALVAGLAASAWFLARPQPAIAFNERDWVVVGDLRNLTGDTLLDDSLQQAFRISLEQSRYVNVLSDLKARDTLERMRRKPDTVLDRAVASEIALRDGARAVILPTVAEVGGRVRVSAEVIDPHTQTTVYAASADGNGARSTLGSIDNVTADLRGKLGEALESIQRSSVPLPNVSTSSLDALKAYALGRKYSASGEGKQAVAYYLRAAQLDPGFALAMSAAGAAYVHLLTDFPAANRQFALAQQHRDRLSPRDALLMDATLARLGPPAPAIERQRQLVETYPDELVARLTLGQLELWEMNDAQAALAQARAASVPQAERRWTAHYLQGIALVALEQPAKAIVEFRKSLDAGYRGTIGSYMFAFAAQRKWTEVDRIAAEARAAKGSGNGVDASDTQAMLDADRGRWEDARAVAAATTRAAMATEPLVLGTYMRVRELGIDVYAEASPRAQLVARLDAEVARANEAEPQLVAQLASYHVQVLQALGYFAARLDAQPTLARIVAEVDAQPWISQYPVIMQVQTVLHAELERLQGKPGEAMRRLQPLAERSDGLLLVHASLLRAAMAAGRDREALAQARWVAAHRGRAYIERPAGDILSGASVLETTLALLAEAEASSALGMAAESQDALDRFAGAWAPAELPASVKARLRVLAGPEPAISRR
jgi:putative peptide modification system cyclase